jgi:hypothetical protein
VDPLVKLWRNGKKKGKQKGADESGGDDRAKHDRPTDPEAPIHVRGILIAGCSIRKRDLVVITPRNWTPGRDWLTNAAHL